MSPLPPYSGTAALGKALVAYDVSLAAAAIYTLHVDTTTLEAKLQLKEQREGAANDDLYLLPIGRFLTPDSLRVMSVTSDQGAIAIGYRFTHPFPKPADVTAPPHWQTNRADLGVSAAILFLTDVASPAGNTYFTDRVVNTEAVVNPDSYYSPESMIDTGEMTANTFPLQMVVDESLNNRVGLSNNGFLEGSYPVAPSPESESMGWTGTQLTSGPKAWTGYGVLHQGQAAERTVRIAHGAFTDGALTLDVAVIVKYVDPRGGVTPAEKAANRLPPSPPDLAKFGYRMPHGAWDCPKVEFVASEGDLRPNEASEAEFEFRVFDWDAAAYEWDPAQDLSAQTINAQFVRAGESGPPSLAFCAPGVLGDATDILEWDPFETLVGVSSDHWVTMRGNLSKPAGGNQSRGDFTGLLRVADAEVRNIADETHILELDGQLTPLTTGAPRPIAYATFPVRLTADNEPPEFYLWGIAGETFLSGRGPSFMLEYRQDAEDEVADCWIDWHDGRGFQLAALDLQPGTEHGFFGPIQRNPTLTTLPAQVSVYLDDGRSWPTPRAANYTIGPNRSPIIDSGTIRLADRTLGEGGTFTFEGPGLNSSDAEDDDCSFTLAADALSDGTYEHVVQGLTSQQLVSYSESPVMGPFLLNQSEIRFDLFLNDGLHPATEGTPVQLGSYPCWGQITPLTTHGWVYTRESLPGAQCELFDMTVNNAGEVFLLVHASLPINLGGGIRIPDFEAMYLVALDAATGEHRWDRQFDPTAGSPEGSSIEGRLTTDSTGNVIVAGGWYGSINFGGGVRVSDASFSGSSPDAFIAKYTSEGQYLQDWTMHSPGDTYINDVARNSGDELALVAGIVGTEEFLPGEPLTYGMGVAKFSNDLTPLWAFAHGESGRANAVEIDDSGAVYYAGDYVHGTDFGGGPRTATFGRGGFFAKVDAESGDWSWDHVYGGSLYVPGAYEEVMSLSVDGLRLFVAGAYLDGSDFGGGSREAPLEEKALFFGAFDTLTGSWLWDQTIEPASNAQGVDVRERAIHLAAQDGQLAVALSADPPFVIGGELFEGLENGHIDAFCALFSQEGDYQYGRSWANDQFNHASYIALDASGELYVAGQSFGPIDYDPGPTVALRATEFYALRLLGETGTFY